MKHTKDIHVVYIITKLELGGAQKVCLRLMQGLHEHGATAHLISGAEGPLVAQAQKNSHTILLNSFKRELSIASIWYEIKTFFTLVTTLRTLKHQYPDLIVHTHSTKAGLIGRFAALCAGIKKRVHTIHGYAFHNHQNRIIWLAIYLMELLASLITTHFICVSSYDAKTGIRLFPRFAKKHSIIRAAVDWNQFYQPAQTAHPFPVPNEPFIFGTVACFKPQKNLFDLLEAFSHVHQQNRNTRLEIIGDGYLRTRIEQWITKHQLNHAIKLHGWQQQVAPIMFDWHAFVLSSLWEGLPCAIVEARLLKLPVLSYDTGGIHDIIIPGDNGFLYKPKDWSTLARGMLELTRNQQLHNKLQNYNDKLEDFNDQHMIAQHVELYKRLSH